MIPGYFIKAAIDTCGRDQFRYMIKASYIISSISLIGLYKTPSLVYRSCGGSQFPHYPFNIILF